MGGYKRVEQAHAQTTLLSVSFIFQRVKMKCKMSKKGKIRKAKVLYIERENLNDNWKVVGLKGLITHLKV